MPQLKSRLVHILRWSEQYTKTDMVYLARGGAWMTGGTIFSYALGLITIVAFANLLPRDTYGTYQYVLAVVDLFSIFILAGIDTAITRSTARGLEGSLFVALRTKIRWGFIGSALSVACGAYYLLQGNELLGWSFFIAAVAIPFWEAPGLYVTYLQGKQRFDLLTSYELINQLFATAAIVSALFVTDSLLVLLVVYFSSYGIGRVLLFWRAVRVAPPNNLTDPEAITYGKHLTVMSGISNIAATADKILLWHFLGAAPVAVYIFAQAIPLRVVGAMKMINRLAFPKMATQEGNTLRNTLMPKVVLFALGGAGVAAVYAAAAPYLFALFFPQYLDAVPYTQVVAALIALQPFSLLSSSLTAQAQQGYLYILHSLSPAIRFILFLTLIPLFGLWGAVFALVAAKGVESVITIVLFFSRGSDSPQSSTL
jgi:O-antigen/teichoic acid export membrane protein